MQTSEHAANALLDKLTTGTHLISRQPVQVSIWFLSYQTTVDFLSCIRSADQTPGNLLSLAKPQNDNS